MSLLLLTSSAAADPAPPLHIESPSEIKTDGGTNLRLPPGYFLEEPTYNHLDRELKRLQEKETRLDAENESLRKTIENTPNWKWWVLVSVAAGATGVYIGTKL